MVLRLKVEWASRGLVSPFILAREQAEYSHRASGHAVILPTIVPLIGSGLAAFMTMISNGVRISNSTATIDHDYESQTASNSPKPLGVHYKTCVQAYVLLPVTVVSIISLAMYKATFDLSDGQPHDSATSLLQFLGCGSPVETSG